MKTNQQPLPLQINSFVYEPTHRTICVFEAINDPVNNQDQPIEPEQPSKQVWERWMDWALVGIGLFAVAYAVLNA